MSSNSSLRPRIVSLFEDYLVDQESEAFIRRVAQCYTIATLERLAERGERLSRRASVLALGFLAEYDSNSVLGRALLDDDRGVRTLADAAIRNVWCRAGSRLDRERLKVVIRLNNSKRFEEAIRQATQLIQHSPWFAEAWNQRAIANFNRGAYDASVRDCRQTLQMNPHHFMAATGMGKCFLQMSNRACALEAFRRALAINPGLEAVRAHVVYLQRELKQE